MSFQVVYTQRNGIDLVILKDIHSGTFASIAPQYGALLHEFAVTTDKGMLNVIDNYPDVTTLQHEIGLSYKSSKLSPFACRIKNARYAYEGETFELSNKFIDGNAIHGLLYNKAFAVADEHADADEATVMLKYNYRQEDDGYPFTYRCEVRYTLLPGHVLRLQTTVFNLDELSIPIADGWHPYFSLTGKIDDCLLYFNSRGILEFDSNLVPTGRLLPYDNFNEEKKIGDTELDNCFLLNSTGNNAACTLYHPTLGWQLSFFPDPTYPYQQLYTPPHRHSIAIENLSGAPDCFNNQLGLTMLPPGHSQAFTVFYKLSRR
jgi:aldose 1-epimerase